MTVMIMPENDAFLVALNDAVETLGLAPGADALRLCEAHFLALAEANAVTNLTRIDSPGDAAQKHYADSLLPLCYDLLRPNARVLDIGSGAGFPGLPLAFFRTDFDMTLLDSQIKRVNFLRACVEELAPGVEVVHARAEEAARSDMRMAFDAVVSRALAPLNVLLELSLPFLKDGGVAICYKGPKAEQEMAGAKGALMKLGGTAELFTRETLWGARTLVVVRKIGRIPIVYPRKAGIIKKMPIV